MIYLDNAATTKPNSVALERAARFLTQDYFNPSAAYDVGANLRNDLKEARLALLKGIGAEKQYDLTFTASGTEADNTAIFSFARRGNVVITATEHSAVSATVTELKNRGIAEIRVANVDEYGGVDEAHLLSLVDEKTSFVSVMHVNNETGAINDINTLSKNVKAINPRVIFHSDGVQAYGKIPYRIAQDIDLYSISAHKIGGVKGVGGLIRKKSLPLHPFVFGGGQEDGWRSGTENVFGIKAFQYAAEEKIRAIRDDFQKVEQCKKTMTELLDKEVYSVLSKEDSSPYILYLAATRLKGEILVRVASDKGLMISTGAACSGNAKLRYSKVALACGLGEKRAEGVLRVSFSPETTQEETEQAARILNEIGQKYAKIMR